MASNPNQAANQNWGQPPILNSAGNPMHLASIQNRPANPHQDNTVGGGGGETVMDIAGLKKNVAFLNWVAAAGAAALIALYFILANQIDDGARESRVSLQRVSEQLSDVRVAVASQSADIKAVLEKVDGSKSQAGPLSGANGASHQGENLSQGR